MSETDKPRNKPEISYGSTKLLFNYLKGEYFPGSFVKNEHNQFNLNPEQAFSIIYFMQEHLYVISDTYECCEWCGELYDNQYEGYCSENKPYHLCERHANEHPDWQEKESDEE